MTCYYMGRLGKVSWIEKYFKVKKEKVDKMVRFLQGKGALMAFFAFLPAIGEVISIALGFMRSNIWLTIMDGTFSFIAFLNGTNSTSFNSSKVLLIIGSL